MNILPLSGCSLADGTPYPQWQTFAQPVKYDSRHNSKDVEQKGGYAALLRSIIVLVERSTLDTVQYKGSLYCFKEEDLDSCLSIHAESARISGSRVLPAADPLL